MPTLVVAADLGSQATIALRPTVRLAPRPLLQWTDDPITTETPIKAIHVNELRRAIDALRSHAGMRSFAWTDDPVIAGATVIRAVHFLELRQAIQDLWHVAQLGTLPDWTAGDTPSPQRVVFASDVDDLRHWAQRAASHARRTLFSQSQQLASVTVQHPEQSDRCRADTRLRSV